MSSPDKYETVSLSRDLENIENIDVVYSDTESDQNGENKEIDDNCRWADPLCLNTVSNDDEDVDPDVEIEEWQLQDLSEMTKLYYNAINEQKKLMSRFNKRLKIIAEIKSAYLRDVVTMKTVINGIVKTEEMKEIMKVWKDTLPSLDLQKGLMLYSPTSAQLLVKPCNKCGGHLEVEYHDVARAEILERKLEKLYTKYEDTRIELLRSCEMYNLMESKQGGIVSKYENEKKVLYAECAKQRELVEKASTINIQLDASNKKFREENRKYKAENERLMEELKDHNKLQEEFDSLQPNIEMLEEKIRILNEKLNGLNEVIVTKDKVIEDLKAKDVELEEEETHLRHNIKELEVEIDALKEANAKAEQTLEVEEVKFQELAIVLNPLKEELSQLKYSTAIDNEMTDRLIEDLRVDARHNEMQYRLMKEEVERLQLALQQKDCMIEEQNEALAQKSEELQQLETALYEKNEQLHGVQSFIGKEVTSGADSNMTRFKPGFDPDRSTRQQQLDVSFNSDDPEHPDHHIKKAIQRARHNSYAQIDAVASAKKKEMELAAAVDSNLQESIAQIVAALGGSDVDSNANSEEEEEGEEEELETEENAAGVEITDITKPADEAKESESESKSKSKSKSKPKKKRKLKKKLKLADMMRTTISTMLQKHDSIRQLSVSAPSPPVPIVKGPVGANGINGNKNTRSSSSVQKYEPDHDVLQEHENEDEPDDDHNVLNIVTDLSDSEHGTSPVIHSYSNSEGYDTAVSVNKAVGFFKQPTSNAPNRRNAEAKISGKYAADTHVNRAEGSEGNLTAAVKKYNPKKKSNQYLSSPTSFKTGDGGLAEVRTGASEEEKSLREAILCTLTATVGAVAAKKAFNALQPVIKVYGCLLHGAMESFWEALVMGKKSADFMTKLMVIFEKIVSCNKDSVSSADVAKICQECVPLALSTIGGSGMIETWEVSTKLNETLKHELAPRVNHTTGQLTYKHYLEYFGVDEDFYTAKIDMAEEGLQKMIHYETETLQHLNGYIVSVLKEWSEAKAIFVDIDSILERERAKVKEAADLEYNKIITELSATFAMLEKARGEVKEKGTTIETQHAELVVLRAVPAKLQTAEEKIRDLLSKISHLGQEASVQSTKYKELNTHCEFLDKRIEETMKDYTDMKTKEKSARARIDVLQINLVEKNTELKEVTAELQDVLDVNDRRLHALVHVEVQTEPDCCDGAVQTEFICPPVRIHCATTRL